MCLKRFRGYSFPFEGNAVNKRERAIADYEGLLFPFIMSDHLPLSIQSA